jgi:hypothetical protein
MYYVPGTLPGTSSLFIAEYVRYWYAIASSRADVIALYARYQVLITWYSYVILYLAHPGLRQYLYLAEADDKIQECNSTIYFRVDR